MKRKWEDKTLLEEEFILLLQEMNTAITADDWDTLARLIDYRVDLLMKAFVFVPWEQSHCANDGCIENYRA